MPVMTDTTQYDDESFWGKVMRFAKAAGFEVIAKALWLYYAAAKPETPAWAKTVIYGALVYFISPIDAIPDVTPFIGYTDDLGVLAAAIGTVAAYIDKDVKAKSAAQLKKWFD